MANGGAIDFKSGDLFAGRYEIVRQISLGGMGAVYEAVHVETRRRRALKIMRPELLADESARARFKLEAQVAASVESEHIVEVMDAGVEGGVPFIVMELLRGQDLGALLTQRGRLPPAEVVELLAQAARALDRTHAAGIIHRDLKPENLFLSAREDGSPRVKVLDFGIAKVLQENRHSTHATASIGTPVFMAPEQISGGRLGPPADTYALGHIAYNLLCGAAYWDTEATTGNMYNLLLKIPTGPTEPAVARAARAGVPLPPAFEGWFSRAVAVAPEVRFQSAGELVTALAGVLGVPPPATARPPSATMASATWMSSPSAQPSGLVSATTEYGATMPLALATKAPSRTGPLVIAGALFFLAIGGGAAYLLFNSARPTADDPATSLVTTYAHAASQAPVASVAADPAMSSAPDPAASAAPPRVEPALKGALPVTPASATATPAPATAQPTSKVAATPKGASTGAAVPPLTGPMPTGNMPTNPLLTR